MKMVKIYYDDILVGEVLTNRSLTVEEALELIKFDEQEFIEKHSFDDIDYNEFRLVYWSKWCKGVETPQLTFVKSLDKRL